MFKPFGPVFICAIIGIIFVSTAVFYADGSPVAGGIGGAVLGVGAGMLYNRRQRSLNDKARPR